MKKAVAVFMILIMLTPMISVSADYETVENLRIGIYYGVNAREEYTLDSDGGFDIGYYEERTFVKAFETFLPQIKITRDGSIVNIIDPTSGGILYSAESVGIEPKSAEEAIKITAMAWGTYRGGFDFCVLSGGGITAVNVVPMDSYLYGVISREMSPSWPKEALKAQAVCARNFALSKLSHHSEYGFDLCNTVCCQAYSGVDYEAEGSYAPVDETSGEILLYNDELVQAVYSSSMGYCTEDVKNVWGSSFPYLVSVSNEYEDTANIPNGIWKKELTRARATEIMNSNGYNIGTVTAITALEYSEAGRVVKLEVTGTNGSKVFERESCRTIFSEVTLSQMYTISGGGNASYPTLYVMGGDKTSAISLNNVYVAGGTTPAEVYAMDGSSTKVYRAESGGDNFIFSGQGWGHGVGMSQYGAKGMAEAGFTYEEILTHYYTGTHLEKMR